MTTWSDLATLSALPLAPASAFRVHPTRSCRRFQLKVTAGLTAFHAPRSPFPTSRSTSAGPLTRRPTSPSSPTSPPKKPSTERATSPAQPALWIASSTSYPSARRILRKSPCGRQPPTSKFAVRSRASTNRCNPLSARSSSLILQASTNGCRTFRARTLTTRRARSILATLSFKSPSSPFNRRSPPRCRATRPHPSLEAPTTRRRRG